MIAVFFIYGLSFFILGLSILLYPRKNSSFRTARSLWMIAGFGIAHGTNEWIDMFMMIYPNHVAGLEIARMVTLPSSFLFLVCFGAVEIAAFRPKFTSLKILPFVLAGAWLGIFIFSTNRFFWGDIWARYLLCVPGVMLTSYVLLLNVPQFRDMKLHRIVSHTQLAAITFFLYAILAGVIVKEANFFPASYINYSVFQRLIGFPVQIARALCAFTIAFSMLGVLRVFHWERVNALQESEHRVRTIASATPIILFLTDKNGTLTFAEGKALDRIHLDRQDITGKNILEVFPDDSQIHEDCQEALSGKEMLSRFHLQEQVFEACYSPVRDAEGDVSGMIGVAIDVTSRVKAQRALQEYREELLKTRRLAELGTMSETVAQQIYDPLRITHLLLQRLLVNFAEKNAPEECVNTARKGAAELSQALAALERFRQTAQLADSDQPELVDMYLLVRRMMAVFAESAKRVHLQIIGKNVDQVFPLSISLRELEQVFFILIQNALDVADSEKSETLTIQCEAYSDQLKIQFIDTCRGFSPEKLPRLFEPFHPDEQDQEETGIGLAVAQRIVQANEGTLTVQGQVETGTTFTLTLPIQPFEGNYQCNQ
jgi:PAS domain S-box-containing protein